MITRKLRLSAFNVALLRALNCLYWPIVGATEKGGTVGDPLP